jgi:hypothetical protein
MKRFVALALMLAFLGLSLTAVAQEKSADKVREALGELNEFIGDWNGTAGPANMPKVFWKEKIEWGWKFKGDDAWLIVKFNDSKAFKNGELKYDPTAKKYHLNLVLADGKTRDYKGELKKGSLVMESTDPDSKEIYKLSMNTAADGIRFIYYADHKAEGTTLWTKDYKGEASKVGESLGKAEKKNICVVSGGLGTSTISYKGVTYYLCCSGCRDAFNENPEKYVKEWEAKKKKM